MYLPPSLERHKMHNVIFLLPRPSLSLPRPEWRKNRSRNPQEVEHNKNFIPFFNTLLIHKNAEGAEENELLCV